MPSNETQRFLESGAWSTPNPKLCPCHGKGWMLSDYDTWHQCPLHGKGVPHPERDLPNEAEMNRLDAEAEVDDMHRMAERGLPYC